MWIKTMCCLTVVYLIFLGVVACKAYNNIQKLDDKFKAAPRILSVKIKT